MLDLATSDKRTNRAVTPFRRRIPRVNRAFIGDGMARRESPD